MSKNSSKNSRSEKRVDSVSILAGGGGTRLWPASTEQRPKQFMKIAANQSLLLQTLERSWALQPQIGVFVVCNQQYVAEILGEIALLPAEQAAKTYVLPEPCMRNTTAALFYVNQLLEQLVGPQAVNLVQTSDHLIGPLQSFHDSISQAAALAATERIVVFGLQPNFPATGYGYIERGAALKSPRLESLEFAAFAVQRFAEKPDMATARQFLNTGRFYWNSGMFCYPVGLFRRELEALAPAVTQVLAPATQNLREQLQREGQAYLLQPSAQLFAAYKNCENISVDYALMEKTAQLAVLPCRFVWNDIGSWDMLAELEASTSPLVEVGDCGGNFVRSELPVALCDVRDLIVVEENGVLLICRKGSSQLVKMAREQLSK